jgi:putative transposase
MRNLKFVGEHFYHIYNRGTEKREVFLEDGDYVRFIHYLFYLNDPDTTVSNLGRLLEMKEAKPPSFEQTQKKDRLVNIHAFCLMPNHYHLLVSQNMEGGISRFMHKLGTGYSMFFNAKYEHSGGLFQGTFKAVHIKEDSHMLFIPHYIHLNPLKLMKEEDKNEGGLASFIKFLESYKWSSYRDYVGIKNFPSVTDRKFILDLFRGTEGYKKDILGYILESKGLQNKIPAELSIDSLL